MRCSKKIDLERDQLTNDYNKWSITVIKYHAPKMS